MSTEVSSCRICFVSFAGSVIMNWTELIFSGTSFLGLLWHLGWKQPNPLERFWVCFCQALRNIPYNFGVLKQHRHYIWTLDFHGERLSYQKRWLTSYPYPWPRQRRFLINAIVFSLRSKHLRDPIWFFYVAVPGTFFCLAWAQGLNFYPTVVVKRQGPWKVRLAKPLTAPAGSVHLTLCFSFLILALELSYFLVRSAKPLKEYLLAPYPPSFLGILQWKGFKLSSILYSGNQGTLRV